MKKVLTIIWAIIVIAEILSILGRIITLNWFINIIDLAIALITIIAFCENNWAKKLYSGIAVLIYGCIGILLGTLAKGFLSAHMIIYPLIALAGIILIIIGQKSKTSPENEKK